ncbi:hypothetical protein [Streptococcus devriesei]|uniref:hypothetical protein n=1 Tax=Streptococcus devriesei TaxID=231233 RepID=UPI0003FF8C23|nr:hypothetical protein [Streptococcus devriesei]
MIPIAILVLPPYKYFFSIKKNNAPCKKSQNSPLLKKFKNIIIVKRFHEKSNSFFNKKFKKQQKAAKLGILQVKKISEKDNANFIFERFWQK